MADKAAALDEKPADAGVRAVLNATLEQLDAELLGILVAHIDTRWHVIRGDRVPLEPLAVCALACISKTILEKLRVVRPAIRTGAYGQAQSGALHRRRNPGPIQSVADAISFEERSCWRVGQLSSLSYSNVEDVGSLARCSGLHTLQLTQCKHLRHIDGLGRCPSLERLFLVNCSKLANLSGLCNSAKLLTLEVSGCKILADISALATCLALENLSLPGCEAVRDISALGQCTQLRTLDLVGCRAIDDIGPLCSCLLLWKLDIRGTGYMGRAGLPAKHVPIIPSVTELRGPGWQDLGARGHVL